MKKLFSLLFLLCVSVISYAQIIEAVHWRFSVKDISDSEKELVFTANMDHGWHLYGMNIPDGGPAATTFSFDEIHGAVLDGGVTSSSRLIKKYDKQFEMELSWYEKQAVFIQKIKLTAPTFSITGNVRAMACNDQSCLPPTTEEFTFTGKGTPAEATKPESLQKENIKSTFEPEQKSGILKADTLMAARVVAVDSATVHTKNSENDLWTPVIDELNAFGENGGTAERSLLIIFFLGFGGGLLALLTPCVWPMIPMTVSFFLKRTKDRKKSIRDAVMYGIAIIVIYVVLGLIITAIFGASALNNLATNAIFNIIFFALLVLFAISFFGAFELTLPASWTTKLDSKADATTGILSISFMAFTLVLVSFSCTGPIIGTLLVQAASMGEIAGPAIGMLGFAVALSIPFSLFAIFPSMLKSMPKSGGWLNSVKVVLGFLELALALKFLSVADLAYGWHILDREVFVTLWIIIFTLLGFYLLGKIKFSHDSDIKYVSVPRLFMAIISFAFAIYMIPGLWGAPLKAISAFTPPLNTQDFNLYKDEVHAKFTDYDEGMAYAKKVNKPVMIDFSGFGCVNCRKMEAAVWTDPAVKAMIDNDYVLITLMVDDKTPLSEPVKIEEYGKMRTLRTVGDRWSYLQRSKFGANAQPFYVLLDTDGYPIAPPYSYNEDISTYLNFLKGGIETFENRIK